MGKSGRMIIRNAVDKRRFLMIFDHFEMPFTLTWKPGEGRSQAQNRTIHLWFDQIAKHFGDVTREDVKAECNLMFGRPIMARDDEEWAAAFGYIFDALSKPAKIKAIRVLDVPFTRKMTVAQLTEYMNEMRRHYDELGVRLVDPDAQGLEEMQR